MISIRLSTGAFYEVPKNCHIKETKKWLKVRDDMEFIVAQFNMKHVVAIFDSPDAPSTP